MDAESLSSSNRVLDDERLEIMSELPYASVLEELEYLEVVEGPRFSSCQSNPQNHFGPITIRNYLAGYVMQSLRKSTPKPTQQFQPVFINLPTEIQLMVLEHLHPIDLYHISTASKIFRNLVMNPNAVGVWRLAFRRHPDLPKCPPTVTESQWAFMLYGPGICVKCGKHGALTDFAFLKQYCEVCMKVEYAYRATLRDSANNAVQSNHIVCSLVPRSFRYHGLRYTTSYVNAANARYIRKDFDAMMRKVTLVQVLIDHGVPGLADLFDEYIVALTSRRQEMEKTCNEANAWANEVFREFTTQYEVSLRKVFDICRKRLKNRGHDIMDITIVQFSLIHVLRLQRVYRFTRKAFRLALPKLDIYITQQKVARLKRERQKLLEAIYRDYEKTLSPEIWETQPPAHLVKEIEAFSEFLNAPYTKRGDMAPGDAVSLFPGFVTDWTKKNQQEILKLLHGERPTQEFIFDTKNLELATSVITCSECKLRNHDGRALLGWKDICIHKRTPVGGYSVPCSTFEVSSVATTAAASLISCVGLNPGTTTIHEMNYRNDRFMCGNCLPETSHGITGLNVYSWIECIKHSMDMHILANASHSTPLWFLLTTEAKKFAMEHENAHPRPVTLIWRCNHCAAHYDERVSQKEASRHVKEVHLIQSPNIGVDVVHARTYPIKRRKPFRLGTEPAYDLRCQHCPILPIYKLWEMQDLRGHLRVKHRVSDPVEGEDWTRIEIIATTPPSDTTETTS